MLLANTEKSRESLREFLNRIKAALAALVNLASL